MPRTAEEQARLDRFAREYRISQNAVMLEIERAVCGSDYGGTSWTTRDEAERVGQLLELSPGKRLLDVGAGSGWPGLYLARITGCDVALVDVPLEGLRIAAKRAVTDQLPGECWVIVGDGARLPLKSGWFDAIGHSDVLCCLEEKLSVLTECRRVSRSDGKMVFTVISIAPALSAADYVQAVEAGPPCKEASVPYPTMLGQAGWRITQHIDVTAEYAESVRLMLREQVARAGALIRLLGDAEFSETLTRRRRTVQALDRGLLRREFIAADAIV
jgi:ubiquinone/menaquinone biosynthesis C-methylase UbiE